MKTLNYKSIEIYLTEERIASHDWHQLLMNILREKIVEGARLRQACESHTSKLIQLGLSHNIDNVYQNQTTADVQFRDYWNRSLTGQISSWLFEQSTLTTWSFEKYLDENNFSTEVQVHSTTNAGTS